MARIAVASPMQDVASIRARRAGRRIAWRVVHEHEGEFRPWQKWSTRPFTPGEFIAFIDRSSQQGDEEAHGLVFSILDMNLEGGADAKDLRGFIAVESSFYPDLSRCYERVIARYLRSPAARSRAGEEPA